MRDYDFIAMPVIDYQQHLLGIITIDDILDVMDEEASEDYSRLGVSDIDSTNDSVVKTATKRLPWLIILTFLGMITATILGGFEATLSQVALLVHLYLLLVVCPEILVHNHLRCLYVISLLGKLMNKVNLRLH